MTGKQGRERKRRGRARLRRMESMFDKRQIVLQTIDMLGLYEDNGTKMKRTPTAAL